MIRWLGLGGTYSHPHKAGRPSWGVMWEAGFSLLMVGTLCSLSVWLGRREPA